MLKHGYDEETALSFEASVMSFVLGWMIYNQNQPTHVYLETIFNFEDSFDLGLTAIVKGLAT
ncbi:hypothetical protein GAGA_0885 [Paraglaciecola agarilytica NO2]|uniref:Uncharacterized protein n=1 Tax=Paraglaciecola agarilytica NO2 TaxID=1125747 RepID=A0ABQ0I382_9ALTE|nr:hypothetical protein GAGA_0885 [Paraglaciecola agarilytica NO2]